MVIIEVVRFNCFAGEYAIFVH